MKRLPRAQESQIVATFRYSSFLSLLFLFVAAAGSGQTTSPSCDDEDRGSQACLPWGNIDLTTVLGTHRIFDLSKDGSVVAGGNSVSFPTEVFQWNRLDGRRVLSRSGTEFIHLAGPILSENGDFLVGVSSTTSGTDDDRVFRWNLIDNTSDLLTTGSASEITNVWPEKSNGGSGSLVPNGISTISADGNTITGIAKAYDGDGFLATSLWPFLWTSTGGTNDDPQEDFTSRIFTYPRLASNQSRIVGMLLDLTNITGDQAASWQPGNGITLAPADVSNALATSFDGQVVAGYRDDHGANPRAWTWTQATGYQALANDFSPRSVSDDGEKITGFQYSNSQPLIWTSSLGVQNLTYYLSGFGIFGYTGTSANPASGIMSGDGAVFAIRGMRQIFNVRPLNVVSLGDSYSSGEGAPGEENLDGYYEGGSFGGCHRSKKSYPALIRANTSTYPIHDVAQQVWAQDYSWKQLACSGATTWNVRRLSDNGSRFKSEDPQLDRGFVNDDTDLVTISIGGNDALFSYIVSDCLFKDDCKNQVSYKSTLTWAQRVNTLLNETEANVKHVVSEIRNTETDNRATILLLGYPHLVAGKECSDLVFGISLPGNPYKITQAEQEWIRELAVELNKRLEKVAKEAGVHWVPVAPYFGTSLATDHNICGDASDWINGVTYAPYKEHSFHPNAAGHSSGYGAAVNDFITKSSSLASPYGFFASGMFKNPTPSP